MYPTHTRTREAAAHMRWGPQDALRGAFAVGNPTLEARASGFLVWRVRGVAALAAGCSRAVRGLSSECMIWSEIYLLIPMHVQSAA